MKNSYYCVDRKIEYKNSFAYISQVMRCNSGCNLYNLIMRYHDIVSITPCETKKEAVKMADTFNQGYFKNGYYLFQSDNKVYPAHNICMY